MWIRRTIQVALCALLGASFCLAEVCNLPTPIQRQECSSVSMMHGAASQIHHSVLQQLCEAGHRHVLLKGATPSPLQSLPGTARRAEQFAVLYIHRDDFSETVTWKSGESADIMCNNDWFVDGEVKLSNGYNWYTHGLPLWPLLNQTLVQKKSGLLQRKKKLDWPNYAIGTPFYLVPSEIYNSRDANLAIQKRFSRDFAASVIANEQEAFAKPDAFKEWVTNLYQILFLDQTGYARKDISADFEDYANWLQSLVKSSLQPMMESFLRANTPKKGQTPICPDELYVFFHKPPCSSSNTCLLLNEFQLILKMVNCPDTKVVVGYGGDSGVAIEEIIPTKVLRKSESAPKPQVGPSPTSAAPCNKSHFQVVGYMMALMLLRVAAFQFWV